MRTMENKSIFETVLTTFNISTQIACLASILVSTNTFLKLIGGLIL